MKIQRFIPVLVIAVILVALAYAQGWLQTKPPFWHRRGRNTLPSRHPW